MYVHITRARIVHVAIEWMLKVVAERGGN